MSHLPAVTVFATGSTLSPLKLVLGASPVVQLVILTLIGMAIACLYIIGAKLVRLNNATKQTAQFLEMFWSEDETRAWDTQSMGEIHARLPSYAGAPVASVFRAGYHELSRIARTGTPDAEDIHNLERAVRRARLAELTRLSTRLPVLSTTGATAPFVGLFGTVWGIMNSFIAIHGQKSATLDVVAPGIAEALIATAIGLVAAIPAVMAYNYFSARIQLIEAEMDAFSSDYLNILRRHMLQG